MFIPEFPLRVAAVPVPVRLLSGSRLREAFLTCADAVQTMRNKNGAKKRLFMTVFP
jgi:hypothetical protein